MINPGESIYLTYAGNTVGGLVSLAPLKSEYVMSVLKLIGLMLLTTCSGAPIMMDGRNTVTVKLGFSVST